ncbi:MAG TPA: hypothetical protein VFW62_11250, partial [bacterium]|nr:hypothetical protein [bacterium]
FEDIDAFKEAITSGEFPGTPNAQLFEFLKTIDADLSTAVNESAANTDSEKVDDLDKAVTERLAELLQDLYPNDIVSQGSGNNYTITITGTDYEWGVTSGGDLSFDAA